jgi:hypothetical protein
MDTLTFIAQLIATLAWPLTVLACLVLLRKPLANLIPLLRTLKYSDFELQFGREVAEAKEAAEAIALGKTTSRTVGESRGQVWEELIRLASSRPRTAIREAWRQVEAALNSLAKSRNLEAAPSAWSMPMVLGALMLNAGIITDAQYSMLNRLRRLTSEAERAPVDTLAADDAVAFVELALRLAASLAGDA